jgi:hypothetical protein
MIELMVLALSNSLMNWGRSPVIATRTVPADADVLGTLVADPCSQWRLIAGISPVLRPSACVQASPNPRFVHATVRLDHRDVLWITWILTPGQGTTEVDLIAQLESHGFCARAAMLLGGRRWLHAHLDRTLGVLSMLAHRAAENLDDVERHTAVPALTAGADTARSGRTPEHHAT